MAPRILTAQFSKSPATRSGATPLRLALCLAALGLLGGCSTVEGVFAHRDPNAEALNVGANPRPVGHPATNPSDKPTVLPVASQDINCPVVDVAEGGAALRVGGPDNASVKYQFNIGDTARECDPAGPQEAALKVGVRGEVVTGPAGSAGTYGAPLKVTVTHQGDNKEVFSKTYRVEATTDGLSAGPFRLVTEPIMLPLTTLQLADQYSITVGYEGGTAANPAPKRHKHNKTSG
jgi:hypothetical protein